MSWAGSGWGGGAPRRGGGGNGRRILIFLPSVHKCVIAAFLAVFVTPNLSLSEETSSVAPNTTASVTYDHVTDNVTANTDFVRIAERIKENEQLWWNIVNNSGRDSDVPKPEPKLIKAKLNLIRDEKAKPKNVNKKCDCGKYSYTSKRIINGKEAEANEFPFQVSIQIRPSGIHFCGGSIVSDQYILTAAHCTDGLTADEIQVSIGDHNLSAKEKTEKIVYVDDIKQHGNYDQTNMNNDISLLKLAKTLSFSDAVSPVCLTPSVLVFFQEKAMVIGWGKKNEKDNYGTSILNKAEVKVIPMLSCRHDYKFIPEMITSRMFCAAGETTDGCQGDSGGPLVWKDPKKNTYVQIGVTSWGIGCGRKDFPGVYVKLIKFLDWIYKQTSDSVFCSSFSPTADVEISSNGKKKQNNNKGKKKNKRNRKRNKFRRRRRRKKKGNRWRRRKEGNRWRGKMKRRTFSQEDSSDEDNENESVENKERRNYNEGESSEEDYETKYEGKRGRKRTNAKRRKGKLRKRQKQEDSRKEDNQDELKENGNNRRGYLYRKRKPKVEKLRNKRKSRDERTIDANGSIDYNGKIRSGSFKKDFPNGKSFSGDE